MATAKSGTTLLADRVLAGEGFLWDAARVATANFLLILCAKIALPLPWTPVPITGQTFGVMLVAALLGSRRGALVLGLYLLEGLAGMPVFQPFGAPGVARLLGPTGGYLLSYPAAAFVTGWLVERGRADRSPLKLFAALVPGQVLTFSVGCAWLAVMPMPTTSGAAEAMGWSRAFLVGVAPFVLGDVVKMALVVAAVRGVDRGARLPAGHGGRISNRN